MPGSPKSVRTTITLPRSAMIFLQTVARAEGSTVSALIRRAVLQAYTKPKEVKHATKKN